jgi:hypothetical protein
MRKKQASVFLLVLIQMLLSALPLFAQKGSGLYV